MTIKEKAKLYALAHYFYGLEKVEQYDKLVKALNQGKDENILKSLIYDIWDGGITWDYVDYETSHVISSMIEMKRSLENWFGREK